MDDVGRSWFGVIIAVVIIVITAFFCACESAAVEFSDVRLKKLAQEDKRAKKLEKLMEHSGRFLAVNTVSRLVMGMILCAECMVYFYEPVREWSKNSLGAGGAVSMLTALAAVIFIPAAVLGVFGISIPRKLCSAGRIGEGFILTAAGLYSIWLWLFRPLEGFTNGISKLILRIFDIKNVGDNEAVTEEEILMMVDAVNETGAIEESQAEMISNIFEFDDIEIGDVMTHRTEVAAIEENAPIKEAVELAIESGFSRIPVYKETIDDIEGVVYAKDLLTLVFRESAEGSKVKDFMRDVLFAPETQKCGELFKELTKNKIQMAVAVDEYGGTAGVVTLEDLIETIVGSIQDEYDDETEEITEISEGVFELEGNADYEDVMEALGKKADENSPFETIGAMVIELLGRIPEDGETPVVRWEDVVFSVLKVEDRKIERIRAQITEKETEKQ